MNLNFFKRKNIKLDENSVRLFYAMQDKFNKISDTVGVISMDYKHLCKKIDRVYDLSYTIIKNVERQSIVIARGDYIKKYIILETIEDIQNSDFKFGRYM